MAIFHAAPFRAFMRQLPGNIRSAMRASARAASGTAASLADGAARRIDHIGFDMIFNPVSRLADYGSNIMAPVQIPSVHQLLELYYANRITLQQLVFLSTCMGVNMSGNPAQLPDAVITAIRAAATQFGFDAEEFASNGTEAMARAWSAMIDHNRPYYPINFLRKLVRQGAVPDDRMLREALRREGFAARSIQDLFIKEWEPLDSSSIIDLWQLGKMDADEVRQRFRTLGNRDDETNLIMAAEEEVPGIGEAMQLALLGVIDRGEMERYFRAAGYQDMGVIQRLSKLRLFMPSVSDLVQMCGAGLLAPNIVAGFGLDAQKPAEWTTWTQRMGLDISAGTGPFGEAPPDQATWADMLWRAHWQLPTVGTIVDMANRFRGDPNVPTSWTDPDVRPIDDTLFDQLMTANGVPQGMLPYMRKLRYSPLNLRHIQLIVSTVNPPESWVAERLQDNGISPPQSQILAKAYIEHVAEIKGKPLQRLRDEAWRKYVDSVEKAYEEGAIDRATAESGLASNGVPPDVIKARLDTIDIKTATAIVQAVIARARADWFGGRTDEIEARLRLGNAGVPDAKIDLLIATWKAQRGQGHQVAQTDRVLRWYRKGYLTRAQAIQRLSNLEWAAPDQLLLLKEVEATMAQDMAKVVASADREKEAQVREAEKTLKGMMQGVDTIVAHLRKIRPKGEVLKWYAAGRIDEAEARKTLALQGYDQEYIDNALIEALDKAHKKASSKKTAKVANGHAATK